MTHSRLFLLLLVIGLAIRCIGLHRPLIDAHYSRQGHTAVLTKNLVADGYPLLKTRGDWNGFQDSTVVLELPIQMHLAGRLIPLAGNLEAAGRLTSITFWGLAFLLFSWLSTQLLPPAAARWALLFFTFSPLSIFFGQSFQPETLMAFLSLSVLGAFLKWCDDSRPIWLVALAAALMLGLTIKSNEIVHLAVPILAVGWMRKGRGFLFNWRIWLVGLAALGTTILWSQVITHYNQMSFPQWSSGVLLKQFVGTIADRLSLRFYVKLAGYMAILGLTPVLVVFWARGLWAECAGRRNPLLLGWGVGIAGFYLVFGPGGPAIHSYYHFPALPWFCLVAALGVDLALRPETWLGQHRWAQAVLALLVLLSLYPALANLYRPDRVAYGAARALADLHPAPNEAVIVAADHRADTSGFDLYPTIFLYSGTCGYNLPTANRLDALNRLLKEHPDLTWVLQTHVEKTDASGWRERLPFFALVATPQPLLDDELIKKGFSREVSTEGWTIFHRPPP